MKKEIETKLKEAVASVLPIAVIVILLCLTLVDISLYTFFLFCVGTVLLMVGMMFFTLGSDISMMKIGEMIGSHITKSRNIWFIALICFVVGTVVTIAEPDLRVLANTVPIVANNTLIFSVAIGVGIFLVLSFFRVYLQIKLSYILIVMYTAIIVLILSPLIPNDFVSIAFDSGGVTTGPITVPFIMALGAGLAAVRGDRTSQEDSFGLVALCSIGPIVTVLILGLFNDTTQIPSATPEVVNYGAVYEVFLAYGNGFKVYAEEVAIALLPVIAFFAVFHFTSLKLDATSLSQVAIGLVYTYVGLLLFLTGVNVGFMPIGYTIGSQIAKSQYAWLLIPLGAVIGYFIVAAEPAVHILKQQVEDITEGHITGKMMGYSLALGVALSVGMSMFRVITGLSIWYILVPGYIFSLVMTFFVPPLFTTIAFDSGGVASGPMTATFLLPLAMGACDAVGGNILTDAFGIVAFVAMTPLVTIQALGIINRIKNHKVIEAVPGIVLSDEIVDCTMDWEEE